MKENYLSFWIQTGVELCENQFKFIESRAMKVNCRLLGLILRQEK